MQISQKLKFITSGKEVLIKTANLYFASKGFYPNTLELEQSSNLEEMVFQLQQVQIANSVITMLEDDVVCFEKEIVIYQKKSGRYISAALDSENWRFQLVNQIDSTCLFMLTSLYKGVTHQIIQNINYAEFDNDVYLTLSKRNIEQQDYQRFYVIADKSKRLTALSIDQIQQSSSFISSFQFQEIESQTQSLSYGSIVKLKLIEYKAYLQQSHRIDNLNIFSDQYIPIWKNQNEDKQIFQYDMWKIFHPQNLNKRLQEGDNFYLKNISGNFYLNGLSIVQNFNDAKCFQVKQINQGTGLICFEDLILSGKKIEGQLIELDYKKHQSKKDLIQFELCEKMDTTTLNWLNNISDLLMETSNQLFQIGKNLQLSNEKLFLIKQVMTDLIRFCLINGDQIEFVEQRYLQYYESNKAHQQIIRITNIIQCLFQLIQQLVQSFYLGVEEIEDYVDVREILKSIFIFFEALCISNHQNGLLLIEGYREQLINYLGLGVGAFKCLIMIIKTNQNLLNNQESLLFEVINKMKTTGQYAWPNFFKFLCLFCKCSNKKSYIKVIFDSVCFNENSFLLKMYPKEDNLLYVILEGRLIEISSIYSNISEFQNQIKGQLNLISNLSNENFFECRHYFQQQLPTSHLIPYISSKKTNPLLQKQIIKILLNLYISQYPYYEKQTPKLIYSINKRENNEKRNWYSDDSTKLIEKLFEIASEELKFYLIREEIEFTQNLSQFLLLYWRICKQKIINHHELRNISNEIIEGQNFLITAFQSLSQSLNQVSPPLQAIQLFDQFQESKKIFNVGVCIFLNYFSFIIDSIYNNQFIESIRGSQNKDKIIFNKSFIDGYQKIGFITLEIFNHKQLDPRIKIQSLALIEKVFSPQIHFNTILKKSIFIESELEYEMYKAIKQAKQIFLQILNLKKDLNWIQKGMSILQKLSFKITESQEQLLVISKIMQIINLDQELVDLLDSYQKECLVSTKKLTQEDNLHDEQEIILQICEAIFLILRQVSYKNEKFKIKILKSFQQSYFNCLNLGQFDLIKVIYSDQYEFINTVNETLIVGLFDNPTIHSFQILQSLIQQNNVFFEHNFIRIMTNIEKLLKLNTLTSDLMDMQLPQSRMLWKNQVRLGKYSYGYQLEFLNLIILILKYANLEQKMTIKKYFSLPSLLQRLLSAQDVYSVQVQQDNLIKNKQQYFSEGQYLQTIIKYCYLELLNELVDLSDIKIVFESKSDLLDNFVKNQMDLLKVNILSLDDRLINFDVLQTNNFECLRILTRQYIHCFQFRSYVRLILKISTRIGICVKEFLNECGESQQRQKSIRVGNTINQKSQSILELGLRNSQNIKYLDLRNEIEYLVLECEQFFIKNLENQQLSTHIQDFMQISLQFNQLFSRPLNIKLQTQEVQNNSFFHPTCVYDSRIYYLIQQMKFNKSTLRIKQLNTLIQFTDNLCSDFYGVFLHVLTKTQIIDSNLELDINNSSNLISTLMICLQTSLENNDTNYKITIKVLKHLQTILALAPIMKINYKEACKQYRKFQEGKITESQSIIYKIATQKLQNEIIDKGYFQIFLHFCEQFNKHNETIRNKIFYQFLVTSCKIIRGTESANLNAQKTLYKLIVQNNNIAFLEILQENFMKQFEMKEMQKIHLQIKSELKRVPLNIDQLDQALDENYPQVRNYWGKNLVATQIELIQLLVEDHFRPFQDFFREQPNFTKSINILQTLQQILIHMFSQESFQTFNHDDYVIIVSCFDCIKELIQGPCPQNLSFISQPTFLRLCYKILNYDDSQNMFLKVYETFSKQNDNRSRKATQNEVVNKQYSQTKNQIQQSFVEYYQDYPIYCKKLLKSFQIANNQNFRLSMLSEIKFRCSQTLESLTDDENMLSETLRNITQILNEKVLIRNITNQYIKFKILHSSGKNYTNEVFSHLLQSKQKLLQSNIEYEDEKWSLQEKVTVSLAIKDFCDSFIIETGFSLFNILAQCYFKNNDTLQRIYEQIDEKKQQKKKLQSILLYNFYQSFYSLQLITERLTGQLYLLFSNFMSEKQKASINDKIFTVFNTYEEKKLGYRSLRFFATRSGSIEIVMPNKTIKSVIFPLVPHCFALNQQIKDKFLVDLDLSSQKAKLESMLQNSNKVIQKLQTEYKFQAIYKRNLIINLIASNQEAWKQVIFYVIVCQNLMIILISNGAYDPILDSLLLGLNILQIVLQFVVFFIFLIRKLPYLRIKSKEIVYERNINRIRKREIKYKYLDQSSSIVQSEDFILEKTDKFLLEQNSFFRLYYNLSDKLILYKYVFLDYEMIYFLIFTTLAVLGLRYKAVLALLLLDVFWRFPTLAAIINSVWRPITSILLILASFFLVQYYYSLLIYDFYSDSETNYQQYCHNFQECFSFILDVTFKKDSGAPGYVAINDRLYVNPDFRYGLLNFWEFCYYFFAISLVYSIFTGLILDSFGADREEAQEFQTAVEESCLICGIDKGIIEKKANHKKGFRFHSKYEHSVWNYLFFISYIQGKKKSEYNGIESYVSDQIKKESIQWLPVNLSISIPNNDQDQIDQRIEDKIFKISHSIEEKRKKGKK